MNTPTNKALNIPTIKIITLDPMEVVIDFELLDPTSIWGLEFEDCPLPDEAAPWMSEEWRWLAGSIRCIDTGEIIGVYLDIHDRAAERLNAISGITQARHEEDRHWIGVHGIIEY